MRPNDPNQHYFDGHNYWAQPPMPPAPRKKPMPWWLVTGLSLLGVVVVAGVIDGLVGSNSHPSPPSAAGPSAVGHSYTPPTSSVPPASYTPTPADFTVGVIITQKHCFGSYGCNYVYHVDPTYIGTQPMTHKKFTVVFTVSGGNEDQTDNFTVENAVSHASSLTATAPDDTKFVVTITNVIANEA